MVALTATTPLPRHKRVSNTAIATATLQNTHPADVECIEALRDDLPPEVPYSRELLKGLNALLWILKDYLAFNGIQYTTHPRNNCIAYEVADIFFKDITDRNAANANLSASQCTSISPSKNHTNQSN